MPAATIGEETGVILVDVPDGSFAAQDGFRTGDVIVSINGEKCHAMADFRRLMEFHTNQRIVCRVTGNPPDRDVVFTGPDTQS